MRSFAPLFRLGALAAASGYALAGCLSAAEQALWTAIPEPGPAARATGGPTARALAPVPGHMVRLDHAVLGGLLATVVPEGFGPIGETGIEIPLPLPDGTLGRFLLLESPVMAPALAARHPEIRTFLLQGIDDPAATGRADLTPAGFRACVLTPRGQFLVDPYWRGEATVHHSYFRRDYYDPDKATFACQVERAKVIAADAARADAPAERPTGAQLRTYRLAVSATAEYTAAVSGTNPGTVAQGLAAIVTTVNRVSALYERDLAIRLQLVGNQDKLVFTDAATDGLTNSNGNTLLGENQLKIDTVIGSANYDIGHAFSTGGGGIAGLGVVCRAGQKARGVTGMSYPVGDPYDIDYVAHEMGHQFGANHPFNATSGNCAGDNRNASTAYEPGSGTTIMAYAGICAPQNLAANSDDYFHTISYQEIDTCTSTGAGAGCVVPTGTGNTVPTIASLGAGYTIPANTPFALTAAATDADGDALTYCWEEFDLGPAQDPTASPRDNGSSPLFRSFAPSSSPTRLFPSLAYLLANANVPPASIGGFATGEVLPDTNRTLAFRVTVRDNRPGGGGSDWAAVTVTSTKTSAGKTFGPFRVSSQSTATVLPAGAPVTVTWDVANSDLAPVSCANVRLLLSTDGGARFPHVLAASLPNTGSATVTIPNLAQFATTQGRLRLEGVGNVFFDLNDADLTITTTEAAPTFTVTGSVTVERGRLVPTVAAVGTASSPGGHLPLTVAAVGVPANVSIVPSIDGTGTVSVSAVAACSVVTTLGTRTYPITLVVTDSLGANVARTVNVGVKPNPAPTLGAYPSVVVPLGGSATVAPGAALADANGNLPAAPFGVSPTALPGGGTVSVNQATGAVTLNSTVATTAGALTLWVRASDLCGATVVRSIAATLAPTGPTLGAGLLGAPVAESSVPANGAVEPGETVTLSLPIVNSGLAVTSNLVAELRATGGVSLPSAPQVYGAISAGGNVARAFTFQAGGTCGGLLTLTLGLADGATAYPDVSYTVRLGVPEPVAVFLQDFDGASPPTLPAGWTSTVATGTAGAWATAATFPDSAPNSVFATPTASVSDNRFTSPTLVLPAVASAPQLTFRHRWNTEDGYDGGVLEIAINGGAFTDIVGAGGSFASGGYNGTLSGSYGNPLGAVPAWTGADNSAYLTTVANLPSAAAGQTVQLRWRLGCDSSDSPTGAVWRIDSVRLGAIVHRCGSAPVFTGGVPAATVVVGEPYLFAFTATGSPAPIFSLAGGTLPAGLTLSPAGVLAGTATSAGTGWFNGLSVRAANGIAPAATQAFSLRSATRFANYVGGFGLVGATAEATADPDGDGLANLLEYALVTHPALGNPAAPSVTVKTFAGSHYLTLQFTRSSVATDLTYVVEATSELAGGHWEELARSTGGGATTGVGLVGETGSPPLLTVEVRDTVAIAAPLVQRRFIRLRVTTP